MTEYHKAESLNSKQFQSNVSQIKHCDLQANGQK